MNQILFKYSTGPWGFLSNFSPHPIEFDGRRWPTSEHCYQAMKFVDPKLQESVRWTNSPKASKAIANANRDQWRSDFHDIKLNIMKDIIRAKIQQYPECAKQLIQSTADIIEDSNFDDFWGNGPNKDGQNHLGRIWMEIRAELQNK